MCVLSRNGRTSRKGREDNHMGNDQEQEKRITPGPNTDLGKLKVITKNEYIVNHLKRQTSILKKFMRCDKCPLGPKDEEIEINNRIIRKKMPPKCKYWQKGIEPCIMEPEHFAKRMYQYFKFEEKNNARDSIKAVLVDVQGDIEHSRFMDIAEKGKIGWTTIEARKLQVELLKNLVNYEKQSQTNVQINNSQANYHINKNSADVQEFLREAMPLNKDQKDGQVIDVEPIKDPEEPSDNEDSECQDMQ